MTTQDPWHYPPVVFDCGSYLMKGGFAVDNHPVSVVRSVVGRPSYLNGTYGRFQTYDVLFGQEAIETPDYDAFRPIQNGKIVHWDNMERLWHYMFYKSLRVAPEDRSVFLGLSPCTPMSDKIKICQVMFEALNVPAVCMQPNAALAIFGSGKGTGIVIDIGFDSTDVTAVYEGGVIGYTNVRTGYATREVFEFFRKDLAERNIDIGTNPYNKSFETMLRDTLYVTRDVTMPRRGIQKYVEHSETGDYTDVTQTSFMAGEMFFQPDLVLGYKAPWLSLVEAADICSHRCDADLREDLFKAVVLVGGLAATPGLAKRLERELSELQGKPANVVVSDEANVVSWMGGACFAGVPEGHRLWLTRKQYDERGEAYIRNIFIP